jgi:hypothetical protein
MFKNEAILLQFKPSCVRYANRCSRVHLRSVRQPCLLLKEKVIADEALTFYFEIVRMWFVASVIFPP